MGGLIAQPPFGIRPHPDVVSKVVGQLIDAACDVADLVVGGVIDLGCVVTGRDALGGRCGVPDPAGERPEQCRALLRMLSWVEAPAAVEVLSAARSRPELREVAEELLAER